jgi:hypothetical protein
VYILYFVFQVDGERMGPVGGSDATDDLSDVVADVYDNLNDASRGTLGNSFQLVNKISNS